MIITNDTFELENISFVLTKMPKNIKRRNFPEGLLHGQYVGADIIAGSLRTLLLGNILKKICRE